MDEQLRKRLEEDANKYINNHSNYLCSAFLKDRLKEAYAAGAEYGYKEAIAMAKEWMLNNVYKYAGISGTFFRQSMLVDFEADMTKLLEKQK